MIGKFLTLAFVFVLSGMAVTAQTPAPQPERPQAFSFSFDGAGGYLGARTEEVTKENFSRFGLREVRGVAVAEVLEGSPAQAAGLQKGDVIVRVNGDEITSSRKLTRLIGEISPDHTAKLTVSRSGSEREINVTLGKRPEPKFFNGSFHLPEGFDKFEVPNMEHFDFPKMENIPNLDKLPRFEGRPGEPHTWSIGSRRQIGVGLTPLTKQLSDHFGVENGALVNTVRENSPAAKAGLKAGDIIVEVDGKAVKGELDVIRALGEKKDGDVTLTYVRDRNRRSVTLTPEEGKGGFEHFEFYRTPDAPDAPATPGVNKFVRPATPSPAPMVGFFGPGRIV
jgi:membrane-associated protease RseP (regulator of RpoE activity)